MTCPICNSTKTTELDNQIKCNGCGTNMIKTIDEEVLFPYNCIFPTRDRTEFFKLQIN